MSGYKRVNFYELCRLCASNQQKEKTHIFQEEGRKIQLQNKIQSCLSLTVCENDFLPKVVCAQCLRSLEECYVFRKECVSSESMLSSYFKNFRYTEDFKRSGKVYIKDTSTKTNSAVTQTVISNEAVSSTTTSLTFAGDKNVVLQQSEVKNNSSNKTHQQQQQQQQQQQSLAYSINPLNLAANIKNVIPKHVVTEALGNLAVNTNNEIINIAQLVDLESLVCQPNLQKRQKLRKPQDNVVKMQEDPSGVIKIQVAATTPQNDLIDTGDFDLNPQLKLPHIKTTNNNNNNKFTTYSIKIDDMKNSNANQTVLINHPLDQSQVLYTTTAAAATTTPQPTITTNNPTIHSTNFQQVIETNTRSSFITTKHYVDDQQQQQNFTTMQLNNNNNNSSKNHMCEICTKTFKRREHLYQHVKLHTGFRPFTCESCSKSFMRKEHLLRHMTSHSGQKNYMCNICEKSFSRNDNLLKHRKTHEKQNSFTCEVCQKQFVMKHYYVAHKLTHETAAAVAVEKCTTISGNNWGLLKV